MKKKVYEKPVTKNVQLPQHSLLAGSIRLSDDGQQAEVTSPNESDDVEFD